MTHASVIKQWLARSFTGPRLPLHFSISELKHFQILIRGKSSWAAELFSEGSDVDCDPHTPQTTKEIWKQELLFWKHTLSRFRIIPKVLVSHWAFSLQAIALNMSWRWTFSAVYLDLCRGRAHFVYFPCRLSNLPWNWWMISSEVKTTRGGVQSICGIPGDRVRTPLAGLSFSYPLVVNPHQSHPQICGQETSVLLSTWPTLQERVSKVTSQQTPGPLKHIWVAPAGPEAIADGTENQNHLKMASNLGIWAKTMFSLSEGWNVVCWRGFL